MIESLFNPEFMTRELAFGMNLAEFLTILAMLVMTYSTRLLGWLFLKNRRFSVRTQALLEAAPGCVMVSIAAPFFFTTNSAHLCALAVAILVSRKYGLAWTVAACVATAAVLGHLLG